ncbi:T9SS type A sorting domain-containing protein [Algibacter amylolyticus]|uniref:T9SS type A sorting domain-containing protein n=1 Tax=Algibacter amylolyticus TaxID=1608400 RepID=A0A5M7B6R5_9FLAO|nr:leucine-rich repeat domain-containing protein [Algibacter amylolyticus]KAA5825216.1 T9SS type A sorting domain-containing protein [Algibacter amylolyticus]MBB5268662.1 hypothetical protein [Algibacter amylolyticus]TSJ77710.1 T9SS type A sorting domain-containing protein [Algibacter amylolyticus]
MKKTLQFLFALMVTATISAQKPAIDFNDGTFNYTITDATNGYVDLHSMIVPETNVVIPGSTMDGFIPYTVTGIGVGAFSVNTANNKGAGNEDNAAVETVSLPASVTKLDAHVFRDNPNLTTINLENIVDMGSNAFVLCKGLTGVIDLSACTDLDNYAFFDCPGITGLNIPVVETIGNGGLYNMDGVKEFNVPSSVVSVGTLFLGDTGGANILEQVQLNWDATQLANVTFANDSKFFRMEWLPNGVEGDDFNDTTVKIYVPVGSKSAYETHPSWGKFPSANIIEGTMPALSVKTVDAKALGFSVYPNPTSGVVSIKNVQAVNAEVSVFDLNGRSLLNRNVNTNLSEINISNLSAGMYLFKVKTDAGQFTQRIVKQ